MQSQGPEILIHKSRFREEVIESETCFWKCLLSRFLTSGSLDFRTFMQLQHCAWWRSEVESSDCNDCIDFWAAGIFNHEVQNSLDFLDSSNHVLSESLSLFRWFRKISHTCDIHPEPCMFGSFASFRYALAFWDLENTSASDSSFLANWLFS